MVLTFGIVIEFSSSASPNLSPVATAGCVAAALWLRWRQVAEEPAGGGGGSRWLRWEQVVEMGAGG